MAVHMESGKRTNEHNKISSLKGNIDSDVRTMIDSRRGYEIWLGKTKDLVPRAAASFPPGDGQAT